MTTQSVPRTPRPPRQGGGRAWHRVLAGALALITALGVSALFAPSASAALPATGAVGPTDPASLFPSYYADSNGLQLQLCQDGLPNCLAGPEQVQDVHAAGGDAEAFYFHASTDIGPFTLEAALEAAYFGAGPDQEMTFMRTQATGKNVTPNGKYTFTDPYGTYTCTADATGLVQPAKGCRFETGAIPGNFDAALKGRLGPWLTWDTFGSTAAGAPPAGFIGDNTTPHAVVGSPTGFNKMRVEGPGMVGTCTNTDGTTVTNCQETDKIILQGKVQPGGSTAALSAGTLDFGDIPGTPPVKKTLTYANTGNAPITMGSVAVTGASAAAFDVTNNCPVAPATVDVGTRCTIDVTFTPEAGKTSAATLTVADDTAVATRDVALKGSNLGVPVVVDPAPPAAVGFPATAVGATSPQDNVVIGNTGNGPATISTIALTGANAAHYKLGPNNTCTGTPVAPDGGCEIGVVFAPTTAGSKTANLRVTDANGKILNVPLTGTASSDTVAPTAPTLSAATLSGTTANLTWTAATDNIGVTGYQVFRDGTQVGANLAATARSFADTGLAPGTYSYTVKALDAANNASVPSNARSVTVAAPDTVAPTIGTLSGTVAGTTANLSWTAATDNVGVTGYQVFRGTTQVGANLPATARTLADAGLAPGTYSYTVKALDAAGNVSAASNAVSLTVAAPDTVAPTIGTLSGSLTTTTANLSWTAATDNIGVTGYQVFRDGTQVGANLAATARSFADANLASGTYSYTLKALDAAGNVSAASNAVSLTVPPAGDTVRPTIGTLSGTVAGTTANLSWTAATDNVGVTGYQVFRGTTQVGANLPATARTLADAGLAAGTYSYTVKALDAAGNVSLASNAVSLTVVGTTNAAPNVTGRTPAINATGFARTGNILVTFSEPVTNVTTSTVVLKGPAGGVIATTVTKDTAVANRWIVNPTPALAASSKYTLTLTGGATGIKDTAGAALVATATSPLSWSFTTGL